MSPDVNPLRPGRSKPRALLALAGAGMMATLAGCASAPLAIINGVEPTYGVAITHNIAYAGGPGGRHTLDVYAPRKPRPGAPVVVFLYGGGWDSGQKADYKFVGAALASHGYLTVVPDYRIYPEVRYPAFLQDSAAAVRWTRDHAGAYGFDPHQIFLMGHSAGAYNAVMLGADPQWLGAVGMDPKRDIRGVVGLAGPYDFLPLQSDELKDIFGPEDQRPATQPINHITGNEPPMFLGHDLGDKVVYVKNTRNYAAKAQAAGDQVETRYYKHLSHALLVAAIAAPLRFLGPVFRDLTTFIDGEAAKAVPAKAAAAAPQPAVRSKAAA